MPLFNGKDLTGWKTHPSQPGKWRVENGVLIGSGPTTSHLYTQRGDYKDFHVHIEARINDGGNSGIICRTAFAPSVNFPFVPLGYEAQINSTHRDLNKTGSLYVGFDALVSIREAPVPPGKWFTVEVIAEDKRIIVKIDGKTTADYTDNMRRFTSGHIVLQQHNPQTVAEFRKIEIKELPAPKPATEEKGFVPLFNGKDLIGWKTHPTQRGNWCVEKGVLTTSGLRFTDKGGAHRSQRRNQPPVHQPRRLHRLPPAPRSAPQ